LADFLVDRGIIHADHPKKANQKKKRVGERLEQTIVRLEYFQEAQILQGLEPQGKEFKGQRDHDLTVTKSWDERNKRPLISGT